MTKPKKKRYQLNIRLGEELGKELDKTKLKINVAAEVRAFLWRRLRGEVI